MEFEDTEILSAKEHFVCLKCRINRYNTKNEKNIEGKWIIVEIVDVALSGDLFKEVVICPSCSGKVFSEKTKDELTKVVQQIGI